MPLSTLLEPLAGAWKRRLGGAPRQALLALAVAALFVGAHVARVGTTPARGAAAALIVLVLVVLAVRVWRERRAWTDARRAIRRVLTPADPELAARALRAFTLVERASTGRLETSSDLAALHFERLLARATPQVIERGAGRQAARWRRLLLAVSGVAVVAFAVGPMRIIEGLDVLVARGPVAPLPLVWLDYPTVTVQPPAYLREEDRLVLLGDAASLPYGALVTVRGKPTRPARSLVLTDGATEVAFVSDGAGGVVASFTVETSAEVRVAARFGDVLVVEPDALAIEAVSDAAPRVTLGGAPREVSLEETSRVELYYEAADDHGLRQVDLVLRAGNREDRRVLARLDGERRSERGGHALAANDPFLRRMFLPTQVTIEARDNDPITGPKWGRSQPITLVPPPLGAPEAQRLTRLMAARDQLVDLLAWQLGSGGDAAAERQHVELAVKTMEAALDPDAPLPVPDGLLAYFRGQTRVLVQPLAPGASRARRTEDVLLAVDVAIERLAQRDARTVSVRLADVADEVAAASRLARETEDRAAGLTRLDAALAALRMGTRQLALLGALGQDLGSVAQGEGARIERSRGRDDLLHAELAAKHLAARLRRPNPSFVTKRTGGVESAGGVAADAGEASQADQRFDELARELEELAHQHAGEIGAVERALGEAAQKADVEALRAEARQRAEVLRRDVADLPPPGAEPGSARSSASIAREHAGAMAELMEQLALEEAAESGRRALSNLDEAARQASERGLDDWLPEGSLERARKALREQLAWVEKELAVQQRDAEAAARGALAGSGARERQHAQRAGNLSSRGRNGQTALPEATLDHLERAEALMNDAAQALQAGQGARALKLQREAQRLLEQATQGRTTDESRHDRPERSGDGPGKGGLETKGDVPEEGDDGARDFRQRVVDGLGGERSGVLAPAIRRYAEGLLR